MHYIILLQDHACRSETVDLARELDYNAAAAWVGHPYFDVIDNSTDFETKICRMIAVSISFQIFCIRAYSRILLIWACN